MSRGGAQLRDLILLVLIRLGLFLAFGQFLFEIITIVAGIGLNGMRRWIEFQNRCDCVIKKGAIVGDDQCRTLEAVQPVFEPFEHFDVEMIGGFIEQQKMRLFQQNTRQHQTRLLSTAEVFDGCVEGQVVESQGSKNIGQGRLETGNLRRGLCHI